MVDRMSLNNTRPIPSLASPPASPMVQVSCWA